MAQNLRVRNPSGAITGNADLYLPLREFCTCPGCRAVWTHMETGNLSADEKWARENYSRETQCMECGLVTEAIPGRTLWQTLRGYYRRTVDREPVMDTMDYGEEER